MTSETESLSCVGSSDSPSPESILLIECRVRSSPCSVRNLAPPPRGGDPDEVEVEGGGACREEDTKLDILERRLGLLPPLHKNK